ncbi:type I-E CRISPR-associated protein Cas7/Cse4/CasC [Salisaeta longa]|uniref:type I-E CRISPR-associated protein Cas7/Cse4/CasC n=1 Tax=Salisaeta longa TaxID=503170 RepID=UPI0003B62A43|nr:type I-E CRISPR-associated protein Cas7/Cse4/CasC [Salisaeta longa]
MFIQLHTLTSYPATLLNRDDAGFAKALPFGGSTRTRVSSQCLKYHWRNYDGAHALRDAGAEMAVRSRRTFQKRVAQPLIDDGYPAPLVRAVTFALKERLLSDKKATKTATRDFIIPEKPADALEDLNTNQIVVLGVPEVRYVRSLAAEKIDAVREDFPIFWEAEEPDDAPLDLDKDTAGEAADAMRDISKRDLKKNLKALTHAAGLDAAMFGRMATSDVLARGDAALHVAHAFTTHAQESESDYFTAVDELVTGTGELGSALIQTQDLTSGLFYSYVVVDVPLLVSNIEGVPRADWTDADRALAADVMERFVHILTTVSPGAKRGSTAPYAHAQCLLAEVGTAQPRTLANAFHTPVPQQDVVAGSYKALGRYVKEMDGMYGLQTDRRLAAMGPVDGLTDAVGVDATTTVPDIARWTADQIRTA